MDRSQRHWAVSMETGPQSPDRSVGVLIESLPGCSAAANRLAYLLSRTVFR